jgi:type II secretory pathway component PulM
LCLAIVGPPMWGPLSEEMQIATARHTEMVGQLAALQARCLRHLPTKAFWVDVVGEMLAEF